YQKHLPQRGDLIEIFRGSYQHWAVYVGDGSVVHLVVPSKSHTHLSQHLPQGDVREESLRVVVGNDRWQINNRLDSTHEPRPADVIVTEARSWVGRNITYHSIWRNCEHFATELRYGVSASQQVGGTIYAEVQGSPGGGILLLHFATHFISLSDKKLVLNGVLNHGSLLFIRMSAHLL
uniref:LRAT domain-containing protein n=1 Tax=Oreochromis niloticus TaxID=8128 RepID=A0A669DII2_ORENI